MVQVCINRIFQERFKNKIKNYNALWKMRYDKSEKEILFWKVGGKPRETPSWGEKTTLQIRYNCKNI